MRKYLLMVLFLLLGCASNVDEDVRVVKEQIINGHKVQHSEYPSIVSLARTYNGMSYCTGTLLRKDMVLTAAHCVHSSNNIEVVYGSNAPVYAEPEQVYSVFDSVQNPDYDYYKDFHEKKYNDIAVVVLNEPISNGVCSTILPPTDFENTLFENNIVTIVGYGHIEAGDYSDSGELYAANTVIASKSDYEMVVGDANTPNACHGDSGGPAYVNFAGTKYVTGVTSRAFDYPLCETGAVYTLPGMYLDWIDSAYEQLIESRGIRFSEECPTQLSKPSYKIPTVHPGGGCSMSPVRNDTSVVGLFALLLMFIYIVRSKNNYLVSI